MAEFKFRIAPDMIGCFGEVTFGGLSRLFQQAATRHARTLGYTSNWYSEHERGWVAHKSTIHQSNPIRPDSRVKITTAIRRVKRASSHRTYTIHDTESGTEICTGWTEWIFINRNNGRITRIPEDVRETLLEGRKNSNTNDRWEPDISSPPDSPYRSRRQIEFRDLDEFGHANNTVYVDFAEELIMRCRSSYRERIRRMYLKYVDETEWGDQLQTACWTTSGPRDSGSMVDFVFTRPNSDQRIIEGRAVLDKRDT